MSLQANITVPYNDFVQLEQDSTKLSSVVAMVNTKFPDDTCQLIAIKSVLGIETVEEPVEPTEPVDPEP